MDAVGEVLHLTGAVVLECDHEPSADAAFRGYCFGGVQAQHPWGVGGIVLPATPDYCESLMHEKAIARLQRLIRRHVRSVVEVTQDGATAPVGHVQQEAPVASDRVDWHQQAEVGAEFHQPGSIARGQIDVGDAGVVLVVGVNGELQGTAEQFIRAHRAKRPTFGKRFVGIDGYAGYCHGAS